MNIEVISPTRVDLAGGTLDCWPLYLFFGDCLTINLSINVFTKVVLNSREDQKVQLQIKDYNIQKEYSSLEACLRDPDPQLSLIRTQLEYWRPIQGFELITGSDSPVGGGLGGSSSLCIGLIKAFSRLLNRPLEKQQAIKLASDLEAQVLKKPTGTQDYYPAFDAGLHALLYRAGEVVDQKLKVSSASLTQQLILVDTGKAHHSGFNNWQVIKQAIDGNAETIGHLSELREIAFEMKNCLENQTWALLPSLFEREYQHRIALSPHFTSPEIEHLQQLAKKAGGQVKICGAGGGGSVLVWVSASERAALQTHLVAAGYRLIDFQAVTGEGSH